MKNTLTIRIPEEMKKQLQELSQKENKPISDLVRESLQKFILKKKFRKLRNQILPFAEAEGILTDEDVFQIVS